MDCYSWTFRHMHRQFGLANMLRIDEEGFLREIFRQVDLRGTSIRTVRGFDSTKEEAR